MSLVNNVVIRVQRVVSSDRIKPRTTIKSVAVAPVQKSLFIDDCVDLDCPAGIWLVLLDFHKDVYPGAGGRDIGKAAVDWVLHPQFSR